MRNVYLSTCKKKKKRKVYCVDEKSEAIFEGPEESRCRKIKRDTEKKKISANNWSREKKANV